MIARTKVVPPVTPRIIRTSPRQRLTRYGLLFLAFVLVTGIAYETGRRQSSGNAVPTAMQTQASAQRIAELEKQRDSLKQQVVELEHSVKQVTQALAEERVRHRAQARAATSPPPRKAPAPKPRTRATVPAHPTLGLQGIRIGQTDSKNIFQVSFSVINPAGTTDRVTGTIWIAVNGFLDKEPVRLSFKRLSSDRRSYVKMGFNRKQDVAEKIVLPDGFRPKNILIEAKPYGEKYTGTSQKISWTTH